MTTEMIGIVPTSPSPTRKRKLVARGLLVAAMAGGLAFAMAMPAAAAPTGVTFELNGGDLTMTLSADATLTPGTSAEAGVNITGTLGTVTVTDAGSYRPSSASPSC